MVGKLAELVVNVALVFLSRELMSSMGGFYLDRRAKSPSPILFYVLQKNRIP